MHDALPKDGLAGTFNDMWFRKQAKILKKAHDRGDADAVARVTAIYKNPRPVGQLPLGHAQHVVVVEKGYANWCNMLDKLNARKHRPGEMPGFAGVEADLDWSKGCIVCGSSPVWPMTEMCGPCTTGESATAGDDW